MNKTMELKKQTPMMEILIESFQKYLKSLEELPIDEFTKKCFFGYLYEKNK
jgi:hypothetical protein